MLNIIKQCHWDCNFRVLRKQSLLWDIIKVCCVGNVGLSWILCFCYICMLHSVHLHVSTIDYVNIFNTYIDFVQIDIFYIIIWRLLIVYMYNNKYL